MKHKILYYESRCFSLGLYAVDENGNSTDDIEYPDAKIDLTNDPSLDDIVKQAEKFLEDVKEIRRLSIEHNHEKLECEPDWD